MTVPRIIKFAVLLLFAAEILLFIRWIPDDAFISFRYAQNLAAGHGLVFNVGEYVEGCSNFLWTLFLGISAAAGADIVAAALITSIICALASVWLSFGLFEVVLSGNDAGDRRCIAIKTAAGLGLIASLPMIFYATSCLETHAELLMLLLGVTLHLRAETTRTTRLHVPSALAFLVVALLRPEGISFLLLNAGFLIVRHRSLRDRAILFAVIVPVALYVLTAALRFGYYHSLLPNTYWAKPGLSLHYLDPAQRGVMYLVRFFAVSGLAALLPFCAFALTYKKKRYVCVYLAAVVATQLLFIVFVGGDVLRFDRFTVPFVPFLLALALVGLSRVRPWKLSVGAAWICIGLTVAMNGERVHRALEKYCIHDWMHAQAHSRIGTLLAELLPADASVVVNEVGAISYYSGLKSIDMIGLTDATVGRIIYESYQRYGTSGSEWSATQISDFVFSKKPACIIIPAYGEIDPQKRGPTGDLMHPIWSGLYSHPDLAERYDCAFAVSIHDEKHLYFFISKNVEYNDALLASAPSARCMSIRTY